MTPKQEAFLAHYEENLRKGEACKVAGFRPAMLRRWTELESGEFDSEFAKAYREVEFSVMSRMLDSAVEVALDKRSRQRLAATKYVYREAQAEAERVREELRVQFGKPDSPEADVFDFAQVVSSQRG